jgi:hypothetical protein
MPEKRQVLADFKEVGGFIPLQIYIELLFARGDYASLTLACKLIEINGICVDCNNINWN